MHTEARQTRLLPERILANGIFQIKCSVLMYSVLFSYKYVYTLSDFVLQ